MDERVRRHARRFAIVVGAALLTVWVPAAPLHAQTAPAPAVPPAAAKKFRVAVFQTFVARCTTNCGSPVSANLLENAVARGLDGASGIEIAYTTEATEGKPLNDPDVAAQKVWQSGSLPAPEPNISIRKAKELDVDGVILVRLRWDYAEVRGDLYFVDARIGRVRSYDFSSYRIGQFNMVSAIGRAVEQLVKDAARVTGRQSVAVLELEAENANPGAALAIGEALRNELSKTERYTVMESSEMAGTLDRLGAGKVICTAVECALEAGKLLEVNKVVAGRVTGLSAASWKVAVIQVDVATGETITSEAVVHKGSLGAAGRSMARVAEELAVTASPDGTTFRYEQRKWRWKTGLAFAGGAVMALGSAYLAAEVTSSNERQKDDRIRAEQATTLADYNKWSKKLKEEKSTGGTLRNQTIAAEVMFVGLVWYGVSLYRNPPELAPVAFQLVPASPQDGGVQLAFSYSW